MQEHKLGVPLSQTSLTKVCKITDVEQKIPWVVVMPKMKCVNCGHLQEFLNKLLLQTTVQEPKQFNKHFS